MLFHLFSYAMYTRTWTGSTAHWVARLTEQGARGVDLFFVLSGFLITGILLDTRDDPHYFRNFYARRALRILPLYYSVLLFMLAVYQHSSKFVILSFLHLSNIAPIFSILMVNGALWSLAVEEHFYLAWPQFVRRLSLRGTAIAAITLCFAEPVIRGLAVHHVSSVFPYTWFRLDGLALGALIACAVRSRYFSTRNAKTAAVVLAAAGILIEILGTPFSVRDYNKTFGAIFEFPAVNLLCGALVILAAAMTGTRQVRILRIAPLCILGDLSYCLYLVHLLVRDAYDLTLKALHLPPAVTGLGALIIRASVVIAGSLFVAMITRKMIERPALSLKRYFEPNRPTKQKETAVPAQASTADMIAIPDSIQ
jgi:peptidoglycan/LPS O-acetylase OafA/YrhL